MTNSKKYDLAFIMPVHKYKENIKNINELIYIFKSNFKNCQLIIISYIENYDDLIDKTSNIDNIIVLVSPRDYHKNKKIEISKNFIDSDFVQIIDPDDCIDVYSLMEFIKDKDKFKKFDLLINNYKIWLESKKTIISNAISESFFTKNTMIPFNKLDLKNHNHPLHNNAIIYRSELFKSISDLSLWDDFVGQDLWISLNAAYELDEEKIVFINYSFIEYRKFDISNTNTFNLKRDYYSFDFVIKNIKLIILLDKFKNSKFYSWAISLLAKDAIIAFEKVNGNVKLPKFIYDILEERKEFLISVPFYLFTELNLLTIGITFYKENINFIVDFTKRIKSLSKYCDVILSIDRKLTKDEIKYLNLNLPELKIYFPKVNKGKFNSIKKIVNFSKTKYLKILDPDDNINLKINDFELHSSLFLYDEPIILHGINFSNLKTNITKEINIFQQTGKYSLTQIGIDDEKILPFNANSIFKTKDIKKLKNIRNFTAHSDLYLLSKLSINNKSIIYIKSNFYDYKYGVGISTKIIKSYNKDKIRVWKSYNNKLNELPYIFSQSMIFYNLQGKETGHWFNKKPKSPSEVEDILNKKIDILYSLPGERFYKKPDFNLQKQRKILATIFITTVNKNISEQIFFGVKTLNDFEKIHSFDIVQKKIIFDKEFISLELREYLRKNNIEIFSSNKFISESLLKINSKFDLTKSEMSSIILIPLYPLIDKDVANNDFWINLESDILINTPFIFEEGKLIMSTSFKVPKEQKIFNTTQNIFAIDSEISDDFSHRYKLVIKEYIKNEISLAPEKHELYYNNIGNLFYKSWDLIIYKNNLFYWEKLVKNENLYLINQNIHRNNWLFWREFIIDRDKSFRSHCWDGSALMLEKGLYNSKYFFDCYLTFLLESKLNWSLDFYLKYVKWNSKVYKNIELFLEEIKK